MPPDHVKTTRQPVRVPPALAAEWRRESEWLAALPRLAAECAERWALELGEPVDTPRSLVVPAGDAVLKLNAPSHFEADHEVDALTLWNGAGAVRVLARDDEKRAFLCERCRPGTPLWDSRADEAAVVAPLLERLALELEEPHPFRLLADEADRWAEELPSRNRQSGGALEAGLIDYALDVLRSVERGARVLVNQDLHGGNVLSAEREPWLLIDPKPLVGERELDAVGLLRNAAWNGESVARWFDVLAGLGLDRERVRGWGVAHALAWGWERDGRWSEPAVAAARTIRDAR
jgi:streptomycin 6-kinase